MKIAVGNIRQITVWASRTMALMLILSPMSSLAAKIWFVDTRHGSNCYAGLSTVAPKRTIQAAINAASADDYVIICGGTYNENLTLSKRLTLFSRDFACAVVDGRHAGHCLLVTGNAA